MKSISSLKRFGIVVTLLSSCAGGAGAGDLVVKAGVKSGKGLVALTTSGCVVVTPSHVVEDGEERRSPRSVIRVIGPNRERARAQLLKNRKEDIALYSIDQPKSFCKAPKFPFTGDVDELLIAHEVGAIRYLDEFGGHGRVRVTISSWDSEHIYVDPISRNSSISEGDSGAALVVKGNFFIGIVLDVEEGRIRVIRRDHLMRLLGSHLDVEEASEDQIEDKFCEIPIRKLRKEQICSKSLSIELLETSPYSNPPSVELIIRDYSSGEANPPPNIFCVQGGPCPIGLGDKSYQITFSQVTDTGADFKIILDESS